MDKTLRHHWNEVISRALGRRSGSRTFLSRSDERALADQAGGYYQAADEMCESMERFAGQTYGSATAALIAFVPPDSCQDLDAMREAAVAHLRERSTGSGRYDSLGLSELLEDLDLAVRLERGKMRILAAQRAPDERKVRALW